MPCYAPNKINYTKQQTAFIKGYYGKIPNTDILKQLNTMRDIPVNMSSLRHYMRRIKLIKGVRLINWTAEQTAILLAKYKTVGNIELAKNLNRLKLSPRKFNKKHIEKKMVLLGLKRTADELLAIKDAHKEAGHYPGRVRAAEDGHVLTRIMNGIPHCFVKVDGMYTKQVREVWKQHFGDIPKGFMIHFKDFNTLNTDPSNLILKSVGALTFADKLKMLRIAKINIEQLNKKPITKLEILRPSIAKSDQKIKVVINQKLTLYVKPGTDLEALRRKYSPVVNNQLRASATSFNRF